MMDNVFLGNSGDEAFKALVDFAENANGHA
jgi:hypothetical protein